MIFTMFNLPIAAARLQCPIYLYKKTLWSLWINRYTFRLRLILIAMALKFHGVPLENDTNEREVI